MTIERLRYKDLTLPYNPARLVVKQQRRLARHHLPFMGERVQDMGGQVRQVSGEGELFGVDAYVQAERLTALYRQGTAGLLYLPDREPFSAHFEELCVFAQPGREGLGYSFMFIEEQSTQGQTPASAIVHTVSEGETLFDIAARYNTTVSVLMMENPHITSPNRLAAGTVIVIQGGG